MKIKLKKNIDAPSSVLWSYLSDYANIHRFHPLLKGSNFIEGANSCEVGSTRQCDMKDGSYLKERIVDFKKGSHYTVDIYETSMPIKNAKATLGVKSLEENKSVAYMELELTPRYKFLQPFMYLMFRFVGMPGLLNGLKKLYHKEHTLKVA